MGLMIAYRAALRDPASLEATLLRIRTLATARGWTVTAADEPDAVYDRIVDDDFVECSGPLRGVTLQAHPDCEPFHLQFDSDGVAEDFCKTSFAPVDVHVALVAFMRELDDAIDWAVEDEGGLWDGDLDALLASRADADDALAGMRREHPDAVSPYRMDDGRLLDIAMPSGAASAADDDLLEHGPWSLRIPGWTQVDNAGGPATFVHAVGEGLLQLSVYERDDGDYSEDDQRQGLTRVLVGAAVARTDLPGLRGFVAAGPLSGHWMRAWSFCAGADLLFVTLISTEAGADDALALLGPVIDSIRCSGTPA